jgi:hypothetical protein
MKPKVNWIQKLVLVIWLLIFSLSIYFGKIPTRTGYTLYSDNPSNFVGSLILSFLVAIYLYYKAGKFT